MLSLTRKADYALVALAELARSAPTRLSARRIAETAKIPLPVLTNVLHQLSLGDLVVSTRGAQGGYRLSRAAEQINLAEIIEAVQGPVKLTLCCEDEPPGDWVRCDLEPSCRVKEPLRRVHDSLRQFLSQVNLAFIAHERPVTLGLELVGIGAPQRAHVGEPHRDGADGHMGTENHSLREF